MKEAIIGFFAIVAVLWIAMVAIRWFNNTATSITVNEVEPGVHCALATSTDGVAIDCWEVDDDE